MRGARGPVKWFQWTNWSWSWGKSRRLLTGTEQKDFKSQKKARVELIKRSSLFKSKKARQCNYLIRIPIEQTRPRSPAESPTEAESFTLASLEWAAGSRRKFTCIRERTKANQMERKATVSLCFHLIYCASLFLIFRQIYKIITKQQVSKAFLPEINANEPLSSISCCIAVVFALNQFVMFNRLPTCRGLNPNVSDGCYLVCMFIASWPLPARNDLQNANASHNS